MKQIQTIVYYYIKELFNEWNISNRSLFFLKITFIILGSFMISSFISPWEEFSTVNIIVIIILQIIILTWLQTLLDIGPSLFSLNKHTYPTLLGVNKHTNTLALAVFYTYKNGLIGLGVSIIFSESYYLIPIYFILYLVTSILSFQFAMIFLVVWVRFIKSFNLLIILSFLSQFILLASITLLIYNNYQINNLESVINGLGLLLVLYLFLSVSILALSTINKQRFNLFYIHSIDNFHNFGEKNDVNQGRITFLEATINPVFYKDLILTLTNPITKIRFYVWGIIQVLLVYTMLKKGLGFFVGILPFSSEHPEWFVLHINMIVTFLVFGEVILSFFKMDQGILQWYSFTKYKSEKILGSKIVLGFILLSIPNIISTMLFSLILNIKLSEMLFIIGASLICLLVISITTLSISSLEVNMNEDSKFKTASDSIISEQIPQSTISYVSLFTGILYLVIFYLGLNRYSAFHMTDLIVITLIIILSILLYKISKKIYVRNMNVKL